MDLAICRICLTKNENFIDIFGAEGTRLNIKTIVGQHFWFQIEEADESSKQICMICWDKIESFHVFYKHIGDIHNSIPTCLSLDRPEIKSENDESVDQIFDTLENSEENSFVKEESDVSVKFENTGDSDDDEFVPIESKKKTLTKRVKKKRTAKKSVVDENKKSRRKSETVTEEDNEQMRKYFTMSCDLCDSKFETFVEMKSHYRSEHETNGYLSCCEKKLLTRAQIMGHIQWHLDPLKCELCGKTFAEERTLRNHMDTHRPEKRIYQCDRCPKSFLKPYHLEAHRRNHEDEKQLFECKECDKRFSYSVTLQKHMRNSHGSEHYICEICAKVMNNKVNFDYHMKNKHSDVKPASIQCGQCGAWLKNQGSLRKHIQFMHEQADAQYPCEECGRLCPNVGALRNHRINVHKLERKHKCEFCDKAFKRAPALREHMATHTGEVLYTCPYCPKTFNSSSNMHAHKKKMHPIEWAENKNKN